MITKDQYFSVNNRCLTRSKIMDYQKSPEYFYKKHVLGAISQEYKDAFKQGSAVDDLLAQIDNQNRYMVCEHDGRTKEGKAERAEAEASGAIILSKEDYYLIMGLASAVEQTSAYKELAGYERQKLLQVDMELGQHFSTLAALPDFIKITNRHAEIVDLKTSQTISPRKYYYHARDYGYYSQFALQIIILKALGWIDSYSCKHLVVEKQKDIWNTEVFEFNEADIEVEMHRLLAVISEIKHDKIFAKKDCSLASPVMLTDLSTNFE